MIAHAHTSRLVVPVPVEWLERLRDPETGDEQPRKVFHPDDLEKLAASLKEKGQLQPALVRVEPGSAPSFTWTEAERPSIQVVFGERRWRAAEAAGLEVVLCEVLELTFDEAFELALVENAQRVNLEPIEEAESFATFLRRHGDGAESRKRLEVITGASQPYISNALRLLKLPKEVQALVTDGLIRPTSARDALLPLLSVPRGEEVLAAVAGHVRSDAIGRTEPLSRRDLDKVLATAKAGFTRALAEEVSAEAAADWGTSRAAIQEPEPEAIADLMEEPARDPAPGLTDEQRERILADAQARLKYVDEGFHAAFIRGVDDVLAGTYSVPSSMYMKGRGFALDCVAAARNGGVLPTEYWAEMMPPAPNVDEPAEPAPVVLGDAAPVCSDATTYEIEARMRAVDEACGILSRALDALDECLRLSANTRVLPETDAEPVESRPAAFEPRVHASYEWLLTTPPFDGNFRSHLDRAPREVIEAVLAELRAPGRVKGNVMRVRMLERRLRAITGTSVQASRCRVCGCTDLRACEGGCSWIEVDLEAGTGLCSNPTCVAAAAEHAGAASAADGRSTDAPPAPARFVASAETPQAYTLVRTRTEYYFGAWNGTRLDPGPGLKKATLEADYSTLNLAYHAAHAGDAGPYVVCGRVPGADGTCYVVNVLAATVVARGGLEAEAVQVAANLNELRMNAAASEPAPPAAEYSWADYRRDCFTVGRRATKADWQECVEHGVTALGAHSADAPPPEDPAPVHPPAGPAETSAVAPAAETERRIHGTLRFYLDPTGEGEDHRVIDRLNGEVVREGPFPIMLGNVDVLNGIDWSGNPTELRPEEVGASWRWFVHQSIRDGHPVTFEEYASLLAGTYFVEEGSFEVGPIRYAFVVRTAYGIREPKATRADAEIRVLQLNAVERELAAEDAVRGETPPASDIVPAGITPPEQDLEAYQRDMLVRASLQPTVEFEAEWLNLARAGAAEPELLAVVARAWSHPTNRIRVIEGIGKWVATGFGDPYVSVVPAASGRSVFLRGPLLQSIVRRVMGVGAESRDAFEADQHVQHDLLAEVC